MVKQNRHIQPKQDDQQVQLQRRLKDKETQASVATAVPPAWLVQRAMAEPAGLTPVEIQRLQRMVGNQNVQRLLAKGAPSPALQQQITQHSYNCGCNLCRERIQKSDQVQRQITKNAKKDGQTGSFIQRDPFDVTDKAFFEAKMKNKVARKLVNNIPSSGMGKFDAEYIPEQQQLLITVKLHFNFTGAWTDPEKTDFETKFINQVETGWSGKYTFQSTKPGWTEYVVRPLIKVQKVAKKDKGHYNVNVNYGAGRAMVGREGSNPGQVSGAEFYQPDVIAAPHKSATIRCNIATHEADRMKKVLVASQSKTIYFDKYSDVINDTAPLDRVAVEVLIDKLPGAPKVPLKATGFASKSEMKASKGLKDADKRRAKAVATYLKGKMPGYNVTEETHQTVAEEAVEAAKQKTKSKRADLKKEGQRELVIAKKMAALKSGAEHRKVEIGVDEKFASTFVGDPYSVAVHEFGHMLGNPDEYFTYGPKTLDMRIQQLLKSNDPKKVNEAINLQEKDKVEKVDKSTEGDRADIQANYAALVQSAGLEIPAFGPQTSSLMSAGTDLLPRHYVALWEALARITDPTIKQSEWQIT